MPQVAAKSYRPQVVLAVFVAIATVFAASLSLMAETEEGGFRDVKEMLT